MTALGYNWRWLGLGTTPLLEEGVGPGVLQVQPNSTDFNESALKPATTYAIGSMLPSMYTHAQLVYSAKGLNGKEGKRQ